MLGRECALCVEPTLVTTGDDVNQCAQLIKQNRLDGTWGDTRHRMMLTTCFLVGRKVRERQREGERSSIDVTEYLFDGFERQTKGVPELLLV